MATKSQKTTEEMPEYTISTKNGEETVVKFDYLPGITKKLDALTSKDLTPKNILQITAWKINRYPDLDEKTRKELNDLKSETTFDESKVEQFFQKLLKVHGIGLPVASAYLRFVNPQVYQIIDVRAYRAAFGYKKNDTKPSTQSVSKAIDLYIRYIRLLQQFSDKNGEGYHGLYVDFEHMDRFLYDIDKKAGFKVEDTYPYCDEKLEKWRNIIKEYGGKIE